MLDIKENESLKNHTTFKIGGPARYFVAVKNPDEMREAIKRAKEKGVNYKVIGGGSNILVSDDGFDGLIIKSLGGEIVFADDKVECFAGAPLAKAMNDAVNYGLLGLEWAVGIPGTIAGAVHNNCGAYGGDIGQSVEGVKIIRDGEIMDLKHDDCNFGYRASKFKSDENKDIILSVVLRLKKASESEVSAAKEKMMEITGERQGKFYGFSAGSIFRNIILPEDEIRKFKGKFPELPEQFVGYKKIPAAWLIEQCGLKGREIGGAKISDNHAGIIINAGNATAENVIMLISIIKQKVRSKFNLQLMEEIEYLGF